MAQKYELFVRNHGLIISKTTEEKIEKSIDLDSIQEWIDNLHHFDNQDYENFWHLKTEDVEGALNSILNRFKNIFAAGGIVQSVDDEIIMIYRLGKWDLPKGKIEPGEGVEIAAKREIEEEVGVSRLETISPLDNTYHFYFFKNQWIAKTTYWFHFLSKEKNELIPQTEEDIDKAVWMKKVEVEEAMHNTYPTIKKLIQLFRQTH
jgi:8-oxo-dGTP pyrophosphatase MutT (NUDIX family)